MFDSCICIEPDDRATLIRRINRTARKVHLCGECRQEIVSGQEYQLDTVVFEGVVTTYKICLTCLRIRESLFRCGWFYGDMWEDIHDLYCDADLCICPSRKFEQKTKEKGSQYDQKLRTLPLVDHEN